MHVVLNFILFDFVEIKVFDFIKRSHVGQFLVHIVVLAKNRIKYDLTICLFVYF
jgi:hypothetical protein